MQDDRLIDGGVATLYVTDMDRAVAFYTQALGLQLISRFGDEWAAVDAGHGLVLGLHPVSPDAPPPGTAGAIIVGLNVVRPLDDVVETLRRRDVVFNGPIETDPNSPVRLAFFCDPDGNALYLCESPYHSS